ncbi:UDP-2,4-diacetamido-2,4,6-trideoxy-beta-L-altropyranose hydrolase [Oceanospirillaceae bacterium]|nr:UDP-2,4-diacetamido-2,4,6-trideoxy-beta-L-altropyranose hydrolase [Oceanospirillaceae bacterium]
MKVVIRTDSANWIGSGHVMRTMVLAKALIEANVDVVFVCLPLNGNLIKYIKSKGFSVIQLSLPCSEPSRIKANSYATWIPHSSIQDSNELIAKVKQADWVVVDHYSLSYKWESKVKRALNCRILAIDDLNRNHCSDMILDQNLWPDMDLRYTRLNPTVKRLLGPKYALLKESFSSLRKFGYPKQEQLLVFFGGSDPTRECLKFIKASNQLSLTLPFSIKLVTGKLNETRVDVARISTHPSVEVIDFIDDFELELAKSKYSIGASGVMNWERLCLKIPASIVAVADNQKEISRYLSERKAVRFLGDGELTTPDTYLKELNRLIKEWAILTNETLVTVDGLGVKRVIQSMRYIDSEK